MRRLHPRFRSILLSAAATLLATVSSLQPWAPANLRVVSGLAAAPPASCADDSRYPGHVHPGGDWPMYSHDLSNTRVQPAEHVIGPNEAKQLSPAWTFSVATAGAQGDFAGTPTVVDGCVFSGSSQGWIFAMNADTGKLVWKTRAPKGGNIASSVSVVNGRVFATAFILTQNPCPGPACDGPYMIALDERTGALLWQTNGPIDTQYDSDAYGSPIPFDGMLIQGISGWSAESADGPHRAAFQGNVVFIDQTTGQVLKRMWTIHPPACASVPTTVTDCQAHPTDQHAGATIWGSAAVDPATKTAYVGTGNPFDSGGGSPRANAIIKFNVDRSSPSFGTITGTYQGTPENYFEQLNLLACPAGLPVQSNPNGQGSCGDPALDTDFGASPNLFTNAAGRKVVGDGQKSGVYHAADAQTMAGLWKTTLGPPGLVGGIVGTGAVDANGIYGPMTQSYLWSVNRDSGAMRWVAPVGDVVHYGQATSVANGVAYTTDEKGNLDAYDTSTGNRLLSQAFSSGGNTGSSSNLQNVGGVSIARNTVYSSIGTDGGGDGFIIAMRPGATS